MAPTIGLRAGRTARFRSVCAHASKARFLVGGNWKCNGTSKSIKELVEGLNAGNVPRDIDIVCAPPSVYLPFVQDSLDRSKYATAAQNCWTGAGGAHTGEVCADMLADLEIPWVITGHSERRQFNHETNEEVGEKTAYAISKGLSVIACIGESLDQRNAGQLWSVLDGQMRALKNAVRPEDWSKVVIAYEPVWAIGTGVVATPEQAQEVHAFLRKWVTDNISLDVAQHLRIIYGGSVKGSNSEELARQEDIDGFLVGGASLDARDFVTICNSNAKTGFW